MEAFETVLKNVAKDETVQYVLALLEDMLQGQHRDQASTALLSTAAAWWTPGAAALELPSLFGCWLWGVGSAAVLWAGRVLACSGFSFVSLFTSQCARWPLALLWEFAPALTGGLVHWAAAGAAADPERAALFHQRSDLQQQILTDPYTIFLRCVSGTFSFRAGWF